jgi:Protein of unknown function (DUF3037)
VPAGAEPFQYATIRLVPRVEREEFLNVGVIVFCRTRGYLAAAVELDQGRARAIAPDLDLIAVAEQLDARVRIAAGDPDAGPIAAMPQSERFHWLVAPSSTMLQTSQVHSGMCFAPDQTLARLMGELVRQPAVSE